MDNPDTCFPPLAAAGSSVGSSPTGRAEGELTELSFGMIDNICPSDEMTIAGVVAETCPMHRAVMRGRVQPKRFPPSRWDRVSTH